MLTTYPIKRSVAALGLSLSIIGCAMAGDVKHKVIEIKKSNNSDVHVVVDEDSNSNAFFFSIDELNDSGSLREKLSDLDPETLETVLGALGKVHIYSSGDDTDMEFIEESEQRVIVLKGGDERKIEIISGDEDSPKVKKFFISKNGSKMTGHTDAIRRMIELGEFTPDELDAIQQALDLKR